MLQKLSILASAMTLASLASTADPVKLQPISDASVRLGHDCGGIKQQIFATGFDSSSNVTGYVFAITVCSTSGKGSRPKTYSTWVAVKWNLGGFVISEAAGVPYPDPSVAGTAHSGSLVGGANYPTCNNTTPYDNAFSCLSVPVYNSTHVYSVQTSLYVINQAACTAVNTTYCTYTAALTTP